MWSSKEVTFISIATGFVFCFATTCVQNRIRDYVNQQVKEKTENPLNGMGLTRRPQQNNDEVIAAASSRTFRSAPPGSGTRWTPIAS